MGQTSYFGSAARPDRPKPEAQRAESGGGVLEKGAASLLPTSYGVWEAFLQNVVVNTISLLYKGFFPQSEVSL